MLKFEKKIPIELRRNGEIVRTVGELMDVLSLLPRNLPVDGECGNGKYRVSVTRIVGSEEWLALAVRPVSIVTTCAWTHDDEQRI